MPDKIHILVDISLYIIKNIINNETTGFFSKLFIHFIYFFSEISNFDLFLLNKSKTSLGNFSFKKD